MGALQAPPSPQGGARWWAAGKQGDLSGAGRWLGNLRPGGPLNSWKAGGTRGGCLPTHQVCCRPCLCSVLARPPVACPPAPCSPPKLGPALILSTAASSCLVCVCGSDKKIKGTDDAATGPWSDSLPPTENRPDQDVGPLPLLESLPLSTGDTLHVAKCPRSKRGHGSRSRGLWSGLGEQALGWGAGVTPGFWPAGWPAPIG